MGRSAKYVGGGPKLNAGSKPGRVVDGRQSSVATFSDSVTHPMKVQGHSGARRKGTAQAARGKGQ